MKREIDPGRLHEFLLAAFPGDEEAIEAAFPTTPAPASEPHNVVPPEWETAPYPDPKTEPEPEIPEACFEAGLDAFIYSPIVPPYAGATDRAIRATVTAAIHAYRKHLRERPRLSTGELGGVYYEGRGNGRDLSEAGLLAVQAAVRERLLG